VTTATLKEVPPREAERPPANQGALANLHPAYFAMVMATGIVSLASQILGFALIARALLIVNLVAYPCLWALTLARILRYRARVAADLAHHARAVGFFTIVAATEIVGSQLFIVWGVVGPAMWLWGLGIALWAVLTYAIFTVLTIERVKPALAEGINGGWLVAVVAAQSVAVLGAQLATRASEGNRDVMLLFCTAMWLGGGMLYIWIIGLIFYRYTFFPMNPSDLAPPYWVNMGAAAISTVAGANLLLAAPQSPLLQQLLPFIRGMTLMWWATATWWIPMLISLGIWRHAFRKFPLRYDPLYWGAVFPLGMYTVATARLSAVIDAPFLIAIPRLSIYVAFVAWTAAALGLVWRLALSARARETPPRAPAGRR
jgi:tellurite resistance protein TehA-like permease